MMNDEKRALLMMASRILSYPEDAFFDDLQAMESLLESHVTAERAVDSLNQVFISLKKDTLQQLREHYVAVFDWKKKTGLYLTAQEYGDNRKRGGALIKLQKMIAASGYENVPDELVDHMPMLYEWMAVVDESFHRDRIERRLAGVTFTIANHLSEKSPYQHVLQMLVDHVFGKPSKTEMDDLMREMEEADEDELPYPLFYD
ncbi:MAG TPA: nitrate reductase molybdenum cofactor assembly chaperone [Bacillales bacterium]|nr:nitrate reductase molybdenum cofactor assembly chaperone [Bacillales bacterium]